MDLCSKPGCANPGAVLLGYRYAERLALLLDPAEHESSPHLYVLCPQCADRLTPPKGWDLEDRRHEPPLFVEWDRGERVPARRPGLDNEGCTR
ncbi:MAG TPA: DUF3499 family protein [Actinomycetota bacterium]|nr:DUF3499 family protein [Actinomycetota bacterium]